MVVDNGLTLGLPGEQVLRDPVHILGNHGVCHTQDSRSGTIILVQDHILVPGELDETVRLGSPPLIDRLVGISDHEKIAMPGSEFLDDLPVVSVAVLGLVHHYVVELALPIVPCILEMVQDIVCKVLEIVEIQGIVLDLAVDVIGRSGRKHPVRPLHLRQHVSVNVSIQGLERRHLAQELLDRPFGTFDSQLVHTLLGQCLAVFLVDDGECLREPKAMNLLAKELDAESVDGADEVVVVPAVDHRGNPVAHLGGRLVGECKAQDVGRIDSEHIHKICIAVSQGLGLAGTGTGDHPYPTLGGSDCFCLPGIKVFRYYLLKISHD